MFKFIQKYTGIVSPGILAVFILGLFWKKTTNNAAIWGAILSIPIAKVLKFIPIPVFEPWMHQIGIMAVLTMIIIMVLSNM